MANSTGLLRSKPKERDMKEVIVVVGAGFIGQSIARRVGAGKHLLVANLTQDDSQHAAAALTNAGFEVSAHAVDISSRASVKALALTPTEELLSLEMLQPGQVTDTLHAYQLSKRGNSLRVMAEAVRWGERGARVNTISPGIIITPLARDELNGPRGEGYRRMIDACAVGRAGTPDEVGNVAALLMGPDGSFITGSDFLMDGGVTAAYRFGSLAAK
jgi:NAD(P)-dependent dehydrogenase (short-subunit alcohol dehydrogenase family)